MRKTYKYRIYANQETLNRAERWLTLCRRLYNTALEQRITIYKQGKETVSWYTQKRELPELKQAFPEYKEVGSQVLGDVIWRLDKAYQGFFRRIRSNSDKAGFPRFKSRNRYNSFTLSQCGWKLKGKYLIIRKVGRFKLQLSRLIEGDIKTITICRSSTDKWYACFSCDNVPEKKLDKTGTIIGIDVGIESFLTDSEGNKVDNPTYFRQLEKLLRRRQRALSRKKKGSRHRNEARVLIAKTYEKVTNQKRDFLHKVANKYIADYDLITVEDLNIKGLVRNSRLSKSISDSSWGIFFDLLAYKAEEAGRMLVKVSPQNTSQICSGCSEKVLKSLAIRIHACPYCGLVMDRDENAARNISMVGQTVQAITKENALCVACESSALR